MSHHQKDLQPLGRRNWVRRMAWCVVAGASAIGLAVASQGESGRPETAPSSLGAPTLAAESGDLNLLVDPICLDPIDTDETAIFEHDAVARFHPHGDTVCASGCALSRHPTPRLSQSEFLRLVQQMQSRPLDANNSAFETLLFYGRQTAHWMDRLGVTSIAAAKADALRAELAKTHASIAIRLVDEHGAVRSQLSPTRVPLDRRHEFDMSTDSLPHLVASGTVKRVGLDRLWTRL